jgi:hypothetical protein
MICRTIAGQFGARARTHALLGLLGLGILNTLSAWESQWVKYDLNGRLTYPTNNEGGANPELNRIPDFSNAGYAGADKPLPNISRVVDTIPLGSSVATINSIIANADVSVTNPGVITLAAGVYSVDDSIIIRKSGLVLRGVGDGRSGGAATIIRMTAPDKSRVIHVDGGTSDQYQWGEISGSRIAITTPRVTVGSRSFQVASVAGLNEGDNIIIDHPFKTTWQTVVDPQNHWQGSNNPGPIRYHRYIRKIDSATRTVTVDAPVFNHLDSQYNNDIAIYKFGRPSTLREVGIENLAIECYSAGTAGQATDDGLLFRGVENCWAKGVSVKGFLGSGISIGYGSTRSTIVDCRALDPYGFTDPTRNEGGEWYNFTVQGGQLILFDRCYTSISRHAFVTNGSTRDSGIVVLRSIMNRARTSAEMHRHWGQGMLFDNCVATAPERQVIRFYNRGTAGDSNHGWSAVHSVIWACDGGGKSFTVMKPRTGQNYAIGNYNVTVDGNGIQGGTGVIGVNERTGERGLTPASLYEGQLADRRIDEAPGFTLTSTPASQTVTAGDSTSYTVTSAPRNGFSGTITLGVSGLPAGITASYSPSSIGATGSSTLALSTATSATSGNYDITVAGLSGAADDSTTVSLTVRQRAATPIFTPAGTTFTGSQSVQISTTTSGAQIFYTTDNSDPRTSATRLTYSNALTLTATTTLRAYATAAGFADSNLASATYTLSTGTGGDRTITVADGFVNIALSAAQSGVFQLEFEAAPAAADTTIGLCNNAQTAYTGLAAIVRFSTTGVIDARNGAAYAATSSVPYTVGTRYRVRFVVDVGTRTYSVYTRPAAGGSESTVASDFAFRTEQAAVTTLNTVNVKCNAGPLTLGALTIPTSITPPAWANNPTVTFTGTNFVAGNATTISGPNLTIAFNATAPALGNMSPVDKLPLTGAGGWAVKLRSNGDLWFRIGSEASTARTDLIVPGVYAANTPVHIACTFTGGTARVYVNGVERGVLTGITHVVSNTTTTLRLGIPSVAAVADEYVGTLSGVKAYNGALSAAQIRLLAD